MHSSLVKSLGLSVCAFSAALTFSTHARATSSAELYQSQAENYGRFEARMRFAAGDGVVSSFFLWKSGSEVTGAYWNELDFEKLGADCHLQTNAIFGAPSTQHSQMNALTADLCGAYHTYAFEWTPSYISFQVDGVEVRRETGATAQAFAQNASAGMQMHFNVWPGDASFGGNFSTAILPVHEYISWVRYSSYSNGNFAVAWTESFDASTVPNGWATGDWASPKGYSTHTPENVDFLAGTAILSLTSDGATGFTGTPPVDAADGGSDLPGVGGSATSDGGTNAIGGATSSQGGLGGEPTVQAGGAVGSNGGGSGVNTTGGALASSSAGNAPTAGSSTSAAPQAGASSTTSDANCGCRLLPATSDSSSRSAWLLVSAITLLLARRLRTA